MTTLSGGNTSNIATYCVTRDQIIRSALRVCGVISDSGVPSSDDYTSVSEALNMLVKALATRPGQRLWTIREMAIPMVANNGRYLLRGTAASIVDSITITNAGAGYATAPTVTFSGGGGSGAAGYAVLAGGTVIQVVTTNPGTGYITAPTITFSGGTPTTAATATANIRRQTERPLRVLQAFARYDATGYDTPMLVYSTAEYNALPDKTTTKGAINIVSYDPQLPHGVLSVYPIPTDASRTVHIIGQWPIEDLNASADVLDFPREWYRALKWALADEIALDYGVSESRMAIIGAKAEAYLNEIGDWDVEEASVTFGMTR